jgi:hypothetical protein
MKLIDIIKLINSRNTLFFIILLLSLIEITPLKLSPWGWFWGSISRLLGIQDLSNRVDILEKRIDENQAITYRTRILRFSDEMYNGVKHSRESFEQTLSDIDSYNKYCQNHPEFINSKTINAAQHINEKYNECLEKHKFI